MSLAVDPSAPFQAPTDVINDNEIISIHHICIVWERYLKTCWPIEFSQGLLGPASEMEREAAGISVWTLTTSVSKVAPDHAH